ncbi:hypothetical protein N8I77_009333 [Diaporthe amygdali]|uniref:Pantothenate transporter liz1 n=1 Tax=Phomopsis amygdali TaxID=1214568 RepID=A0AAD9SCE3_PHOAM|nr:hypothetical protein N8I77_009333 [Diaporthe amygdali]
MSLNRCLKVTMKGSNDRLPDISASDSPVPSSSSSDGESPVEKKSLRKKIRAIVWDTLDRSPEERRFIAKIDFFILTWAGFTYFSKNLNTNNISNAYVSGMKEELNVVGNEYQTSGSQRALFTQQFIQYLEAGTQKRQAALYTGMDGVHGLSGSFYALPDLPSNTRVHWLTAKEKLLALDRMKRAGKQLEEPFTLHGAKRILKKWHFWVYTTYYTFFICSENIGSYMNLWLKSLDRCRYTVPEINTYPTVINAITIVTTLCYGWTSDSLQVRAPIVYFSLAVCFFAAMNLAIWDGVPFGLKWASFYLTGFAQGSGPVFLTMVNEHCAGESLERKIILGSTNSVAYAFNAWIPLLTYNTTYAPRFLVGNSTTVAFIVCAALTLSLAIYLQDRDAAAGPPHRRSEPNEEASSSQDTD